MPKSKSYLHISLCKLQSSPNVGQYLDCCCNYSSYPRPRMTRRGTREQVERGLIQLSLSLSLNSTKRSKKMKRCFTALINFKRQYPLFKLESSKNKFQLFSQSAQPEHLCICDVINELKGLASLDVSPGFSPLPKCGYGWPIALKAL